MATATTRRATLDDLQGVEGKAELIGGRIVQFMATGDRPSRIAFEIAVSLREHSRRTGVGVAYTDGIGFAVTETTLGRESFSPDASYYIGPHPTNEGDFISGPATFAVEVRSKNDYGPAAERAMAERRGDYFEAGTLVVWDVDYQRDLIHCYRGSEANKTTFRRGEIADAEPAVTGWTVAVDAIFG